MTDFYSKQIKMKKVDGVEELFHKIFSHVTMVKSALAVVEEQVEEVSGGVKDLVEKSEERIKLLVEDLEELRKMVEGFKID